MTRRAMRWLFAGALLLLAAEDASAQYRAGMDHYRARAEQAQIAGAALQLELAYQATLARYERAGQRLQAMQRDRHIGGLVSTGHMAGTHQQLSDGLAMPAVTLPADSYAQALESIRRRSAAGERWDPGSARAFLIAANQHLAVTQLNLLLHERAIERLRQRAIMAAPIPNTRIGGRTPVPAQYRRSD